MKKLEKNVNRDEQLNSLKRSVYEKLDNQRFGLFHIKTLLTTGIGLFTVRLTFYFKIFNNKFNFILFIKGHVQFFCLVSWLFYYFINDSC